MPLYIDTATMIEKLNRYLDRIGKVKELYLLVDMGSLEDIYKGLHIENANIGIINNVSTPIALEIGNGIRNNVEMESILQKTIDAFRVNFAYHIESTNKNSQSFYVLAQVDRYGQEIKVDVGAIFSRWN